MSFEIAFVLAVLGAAVLLFMTNRVRVDLVSLLVLASLAVSGILTPAQALSGFSNPAVVTVWAVLILSGGLARTGVASRLGSFVLRLAGKSEVRLLAIIMLTSGILSGFMNSIGVASLFLPVVVDIARRTNRPPSRLLMPLAFASLLGGLNTLIGTPPNILISEALREAGLAPFQMFDFTPIGLSVLAAGILYMILIGRHLLPKRDITRDLGRSQPGVPDMYDFQERMAFINLPPDSPLSGKTLQKSRLGAALDLNVVSILRGEDSVMAPKRDFTLQSGDKLLVEGDLDRLLELENSEGLLLTPEELPIQKIHSAEVKLAEATITPGSTLIGLTLNQVAFRHAYKAIVLAMRKNDRIIYSRLKSRILKSGDVLLIKARNEQLAALEEDEDIHLSYPDSFQDYELDDHLLMLRVPPGSPLVGNSLRDSRLGDAYGLGVQGIIRENRTDLLPQVDEILQPNDTLIVKGTPDELQTIEGLQNLNIETEDHPDLAELETEETSLIEAILSPHSHLTGKAVKELNFRAKYGLTILAIWRNGRAYRSHLRDMKLGQGDALLLYGPRRRLQIFAEEPDFIVLTEDAQPAPRLKKAPLALLIMALVIVPVILNLLPIAISAVAGVGLMVLSGCLRMDEAYQQIEWRAVFLIAGMLPLGLALDGTGAAQLISAGLLSGAGTDSPLMVLGALILLATLGSQIMPNPAVAVLLAPIALNAAADLGISPYPLMMGVAISASAAFLSPVGHPANLLVMGPGGYRFTDYIKTGLPLTIIVWVVILLVLPLLWAF